MSAPKYKQKSPEIKKECTEEQDASEISNNINNLLRDPKKLQKAIKIIEEMISESKK